MTGRNRLAMRPFLAAAMTACLIFATPLHAQDTMPESAADDPYLAFAQTVSMEEMHELAFETTMKQLSAAYMTNAGIAENEAKCPGYVTAMIDSSRDIMRKEERDRGRKAIEVATRIAREKFDEVEIREMTAFFTSPIGRKMLLSTAANFEASNSLANVLENGDGTIDETALETDREALVGKTLNALTGDDIAELTMALVGKTWLPKMEDFNAEMAEQRFRIINEPIDPTNAAAIAQRTRAALTAHLENCEADGS